MITSLAALTTLATSTPALTLDWNPAHTPVVVMLVSGTVLYVIYHYALSRERMAAVWEARGVNAEDAQARGVLTSKVLGGLLLGAGGVITLAALGEPVLASGIWSEATSLQRTLIAGLAPALLFLPIVGASARKPHMHAQYPEIRKRVWSPRLTLASAGAWAFYLLGYELFFRGFLLYGLARHVGVWPSLAIGTGLYVFAHLPKNGDETVGTIFMGFIFGAMAIWSGGFWAPFLLHTLIAITSETMAARSNPDIEWWSHKTT